MKGFLFWPLSRLRNAKTDSALVAGKTSVTHIILDMASMDTTRIRRLSGLLPCCVVYCLWTRLAMTLLARNARKSSFYLICTAKPYIFACHSGFVLWFDD